MTTDERQRLDDFRRQSLEFARSGGFNERHNHRAGTAEHDRQLRNRHRRRQAKQRAKLAWGIGG